MSEDDRRFKLRQLLGGLWALGPALILAITVAGCGGSGDTGLKLALARARNPDLAAAQRGGGETRCANAWDEQTTPSQRSLMVASATPDGAGAAQILSIPVVIATFSGSATDVGEGVRVGSGNCILFPEWADYIWVQEPSGRWRGATPQAGFQRLTEGWTSDHMNGIASLGSGGPPQGRRPDYTGFVTPGTRGGPVTVHAAQVRRAATGAGKAAP